MANSNSNTPIRDCRDTFVHFLADNLTDIPVHLIRVDKNDSSSDAIQANCVNIEFLNTMLDTVSTQQVCIDIVNDDENTAVDWVTSVWALLRASFYTPVFSYVVPETPEALGSNIIWGRKSVIFKRIDNHNYTHYSCTMPLQFTAVI